MLSFPNFFLQKNLRKKTGETKPFLNYVIIDCLLGFPGGAVVKNLPANAGDVRDSGSIPGSGRFPLKEVATHSGILTWEIPLTEEPGGLQSIGSQRVGHDRERKDT